MIKHQQGFKRTKAVRGTMQVLGWELKREASVSAETERREQEIQSDIKTIIGDAGFRLWEREALGSYSQPIRGPHTRIWQGFRGGCAGVPMGNSMSPVKIWHTKTQCISFVAFGSSITSHKAFVEVFSISKGWFHKFDKASTLWTWKN